MNPRLLLVAFGALAATGVASAAPAAPATAAAASKGLAAIHRPVFATPTEPLDAGTAFVARLDRCKAPVLVTALHLFGPSGGLAAEMPVAELRRGVKKVLLIPLTGGQPRGPFAISSVTPADARPCCNGQATSGTGDVAAFTIAPAPAPQALAVATTLPAQGEHVTLLAETADGPAKGWRHDATVLGLRGGSLVYVMADPSLDLRATSGAPVVDDAGRVVAINLWSNKVASGALRAGGNPATVWSPAVEAACSAP